jgi:predicted short-subunit dehydrogenase-like oxidoreductase (DUF2520 family)
MTTPTPAVFVVGAGAVGTALAMRLSRAGIPVSGIHARRADQAAQAGVLAGVLGSSGEYPRLVGESDVVIVAVRDAGVPEVTADLVRRELLRRGQVLLHCSGARPAGEALAPARGLVAGLGTLHPLVSFADPVLAATALKGAGIGIEGDEAGLAAARQLALGMGARPIEINGAKMALYHAAAVMASNDLCGLADAAARLAERAGVPAADALDALAPLILGTARNIAELGLPRALTGPIARGDVELVERHLAAIAKDAPEVAELYLAAGRRVLDVASRLPTADATALRAIGKRLESPPIKTPTKGKSKSKAKR